MAGSVNKVILLGRLGRDPEVRTFQNGDRVVSFSLAMSETWRDKGTGERKERTEWANVQIFNEGAGKVAEQYLRKGSNVFVEGKLQTREYTDKDGHQRKITEVVLPRFGGSLTLLDGKRDDDGAAGDSYGSGRPTERRDAPYGGVAPASGGRLSDQLNDEVPFLYEWR